MPAIVLAVATDSNRRLLYLGEGAGGTRPQEPRSSCCTHGLSDLAAALFVLAPALFAGLLFLWTGQARCIGASRRGGRIAPLRACRMRRGGISP